MEVHCSVRGRDVFVQQDQLESREDAVFRACFIATNASAPHVDALSRIEACKRRYGVTYSVKSESSIKR